MRPAAWQHPTDRFWCCEEHAKPLRDGAVCRVCGAPAAWEHPKEHVWYCLEHRLSGERAA